MAEPACLPEWYLFLRLAPGTVAADAPAPPHWRGHGTDVVTGYYLRVRWRAYHPRHRISGNRKTALHPTRQGRTGSGAPQRAAFVGNA
ncbi:hypothetical protein RALTA_A0081 [Cupriavidus taiwanensis LMG 19424]|uniref:Uncharacterized protein n=2 Tax=Cupriavidus taiwanensis TaxID=164546 RepID=B2AG55_CUPTR|nr:hypothetical protein RALTA_A0081 [Cupriavidus taiwanensis LMG 19424]SOY85229.1 hypothetical protein CBM2598_A10211 [Cupriavidus taiwanensis]SOZ02886.1 hypothetical protein CBM2597_A10209 [Cupriavidus taiwanensis]SPC06274.1 hypothetical protein CBM2594_A10211 [Cupriavidus taiwanensis]SPD38279.1 conserved protein of unknown function [Cupriavidus taiwanensis]